MDDVLPFFFLETFSVRVTHHRFCDILCLTVYHEEHSHRDSGMCGQLLVANSSYHYCCDTIHISMVLLTYIKTYQEIGSTWYFIYRI